MIVMKKGIFVVVVFSLIGITATAQRKFTLKQCIDTAIANNLTVLQSSFQAERDAANYKQSKYNRLPDLGASFNYGGSRGRSIDPFTNQFVDQAFSNSNSFVSASLPLFAGGQIKNTIDQNKEILNASQMDLQQAKDNLTINVIAAYLSVLNNEDQLAVANNQQEVSGKQVERLQIVFKEGATAPFILSDLRGEFASNKVSVINSINNLEQSKITLCRLMAIPVENDLQLSRDEVNIQVKDYGAQAVQVYTDAVDNMALVKAAFYREAAARKAVSVAKGNLWPTLSLNGSFGSNFSSAAEKFSVVNEFYGPTDAFVNIGPTQVPVYTKQQTTQKDPFGFGAQYSNNRNAQFGLNLNVPILARLSARNRVTQARINLKNAEAVNHITKVQLQQDVEQAYRNMDAAYDRYHVLQEQVDALNESFRAAEVRFESGVINSAEYLVIKNAYDRSVVNFTQAGYEYVLRTRILDFYRGRL
jgi:outer membrane protein